MLGGGIEFLRCRKGMLYMISKGLVGLERVWLHTKKSDVVIRMCLFCYGSTVCARVREFVSL